MWMPTPSDRDRAGAPGPSLRMEGQLDPAIVLSVLVLVGLATVVLAMAMFSRVG